MISNAVGFNIDFEFPALPDTAGDSASPGRLTSLLSGLAGRLNLRSPFDTFAANGDLFSGLLPGVADLGGFPGGLDMGNFGKLSALEGLGKALSSATRVQVSPAFKSAILNKLKASLAAAVCDCYGVGCVMWSSRHPLRLSSIHLAVACVCVVADHRDCMTPQDLCTFVGCKAPITMPKLMELGFVTSSTASTSGLDLAFFQSFSFSAYFGTKLPSGLWANNATGKTFDPYDFLPAVQVAYAVPGAPIADFTLADLFTPNFSSPAMQSFSITVFNKVKEAMPGLFSVCDMVGCYGTRGLKLGQLLAKILPASANVPNFFISGGLLGGGQQGTGNVNLDDLRNALRIYFGKPALELRYGLSLSVLSFGSSCLP